MSKDKGGKGTKASKKFPNLPEGLAKFADGLTKLKVTGPGGEDLRRATPEQLASVLSAASPGKPITARAVCSVLAAGCPMHSDGTVDILTYAAFLCAEAEALDPPRRRQRESSELFGDDRSRKTGGGNSDRQTGSANALGNVGSGTGKRSGFVPQKKGGQGTMAGRKLP